MPCCAVSSQPENGDSAIGPQCYMWRRAKRGEAVCSWSPVRSHCPVSVVLNHGCSEAATGFYLPGYSQQTPIKGYGEFLVKNLWKCRWNIQTYSLLPVFFSVSLCPPSSWLPFSEHIYLLEYRQCQTKDLYSLFIFLVCVCGVHICICVYICMCIHVHVCACVHM